MYAIETHALTRRYRDRAAVDALDLNVRQGELFSLLGVNGAGKTTTIKMLSTLLPPTAGDALLLGSSVVSAPGHVRRHINLSPQDTAIAPNLTVLENLLLIARIYGASASQAQEKAGSMVDALGLGEYAKTRAKKLSGGYQRRLSIGMALISEPDILFLDEPTLGLDVLARRELWRIIRTLKGRMTILLTTHYMEEAEALSDRVGVMVKGRLRALGTPAELIAHTGAKSFEDAFIQLAAGMEAEA